MMLTLLLCVLAVYTGRGDAQTCTGNGFVGGCVSIFDRTGPAVGYSELVGSPSVTEICEGDRLAVTHDCENRIPLYVTVSMNRAQIDAANPGRCDACDFRPSTHLDTSLQAVDADYTTANDRTPCYERQSDGVLYRDMFMSGSTDPDALCFSSEAHEGTSRGHMIADSYIRLPDSDKDATYFFTNCIPQFQDFNSGPWNVAEQDYTPWTQQYCGSAISDPTVRANAIMYTIVGVVPSTSVTQTFAERNVSPRWFGEWGFGDGVFIATTTYSAVPPTLGSEAEYRVNMPAAMWTAGCCVATDGNNNVVWVRHTAFGRDSQPDNDATIREDATTLMQQMLPEYDTSGISLFPNEPGCSDFANYVQLQ